MEHDQRLKAAILRVASNNPEFRKALVAQLKTADVEAVRNTAFNVARRLKGRVKEIPVDRIPMLRNYRHAVLVLDPAAESVYLVKDIDIEVERSNRHLIHDPQDEVIEDKQGTFSVVFIPALTKSGGKPAMEFWISANDKLPWTSGSGGDADYRVNRWQDKEMIDWIKSNMEGELEGEWEEEDEQASGDYRYANAPVSILTPPKFDANQYRYFKGPGKTLMRTWRERKENPKWNLINRVVEHFEGYKHLREKPGWEDQEQTVSIMDAMDKLTKYRDHLYPGGEPKKVKKKSPRMIFLEQMEYPEVKSLIKKFSQVFKGKPAEAAQFAYDVLEDANFHTDGRSMNVAMADFSGTTRIAPSAVAQKLGWDSTVLPFAVGIVSGAGDKRGAAQMLKAFVQNNKQWLTQGD